MYTSIMSSYKDTTPLCDTSTLDIVNSAEQQDPARKSIPTITSPETGCKKNFNQIFGNSATEKIIYIKTFSENNRGICAGLIFTFIIFVLAVASEWGCCKYQINCLSLVMTISLLLSIIIIFCYNEISSNVFR